MSEPKITYLGPACESDGVDFGIDGRTVRVSQEAYSIFLAREAATREKIAALQLRLNAADQRIDELTKHQREPVSWGAPKTVRQLIRQLQTLDPELETHAMLRIPDFKDGKQVRSCPLSISYERMEGPWLSSFKGDGRKVIAIWAKPDPRDLQDQGETLTESAESR